MLNLIQIGDFESGKQPCTICALGKKTARVFASVSDERSLLLWSITNTTPYFNYSPFSSTVSSASFDGSEEYISCGSDSGSVAHYKIGSQKPSLIVSPHRSSVLALNYSTSNTLGSGGNDGKACVLDLRDINSSIKFQLHSAGVSSVAFSHDGFYLASGSFDKSVIIYDIRAAKKLFSHKSHQDGVSCVSFHPSKHLLISGGQDKSIYLLDVDKQRSLPHQYPNNSEPVKSVLFDENIAASISNSTLLIIGYEPAAVFEKQKIPSSNVHDFCLAEESFIISTTHANRLKIYRIKAKELKPFNGDTGPMTCERPPLSKPKVNEDQLFKSYKRSRGSFISLMNSRQAELQRIMNDVSNGGLKESLNRVVDAYDSPVELLYLIFQRTNSVTFDDLLNIMKYIYKVYKGNEDICIEEVSSILSIYGKRIQENELDNGDLIFFLKKIGEMFKNSKLGGRQQERSNSLLGGEWKNLLN